MPGLLRRRSAPPILALSVVALLAVALVLVNSGGSQGAAAGTLAEYMPADSVAYAQTDLRPDGEATVGINRALRRLTGLQPAGVIKLLFGKPDPANSGTRGRNEIEPWLAGPVAVSAGGSRKEWGLVAEVADTAAAEDFVEGFRSSDELPGEARLRILGDALLAAGSERQLNRMSAAYEGDSLAETEAFGQIPNELQTGGVAQVFVDNGKLLAQLEAAGGKGGDRQSDGSGEFGMFGGITAGFDLSALVDSLGIEPDGTGTAMNLEVTGGQISLTGETGLESASTGGDASSLIEGFPAGTVMAVGASGVGAQLDDLLEALDQQTAEGSDSSGESSDPGQIGGLLDQASVFGIDARELIASLDDFGLFVTGTTPKKMRGALVATSEDPDLIAGSIDQISSLGAFAGPDFLKPLPHGMSGFSVSLPETAGMPGMPETAGMRIAVGYHGDKLAIGLGVQSVRQALQPGDRTLGDTALFGRAADSLNLDAINLFARPAAFAGLAGRKALSGGKRAGDFPVLPARLMSGVESVAGGSADGSFEIDLNLRK